MEVDQQQPWLFQDFALTAISGDAAFINAISIERTCSCQPAAGGSGGNVWLLAFPVLTVEEQSVSCRKMATAAQEMSVPRTLVSAGG